MVGEEHDEFEDGRRRDGESGGGGGIIRLAVVLLGVVLIGATASLVVWEFVLQPRLVDAVPQAERRGAAIPPEPFMVPFDTSLATVVMPDQDFLASTLMYAVELECSDPIAKASVIQHKARFIDMIRKLHQGRTRAELNDPMTDDTIQQQIVQKSNSILSEIVINNKADSRVTNAFHTQWYVKDE